MRHVRIMLCPYSLFFVCKWLVGDLRLYMLKELGCRDGEPPKACSVRGLFYASSKLDHDIFIPQALLRAQAEEYKQAGPQNL